MLTFLIFINYIANYLVEYLSEVKRIGGSAYLRLPPKLVKNYGFKDKSEVRLREADRMVLIETSKPKLDKAARELLNMHFKLGGRGITRAEIYETDRY